MCIRDSVHVPDWGRIVLGGHEDPSLGHPGAGAAGDGGTVQPGERVMMSVCVELHVAQLNSPHCIVRIRTTIVGFPCGDSWGVVYGGGLGHHG